MGGDTPSDNPVAFSYWGTPHCRKPPQASLQQRGSPSVDLAGRFFQHTDESGP